MLNFVRVPAWRVVASHLLQWRPPFRQQLPWKSMLKCLCESFILHFHAFCFFCLLFPRIAPHIHMHAGKRVCNCVHVLSPFLVFAPVIEILLVPLLTFAQRFIVNFAHHYTIALKSRPRGIWMDPNARRTRFGFAHAFCSSVVTHSFTQFTIYRYVW